MRLLESSSRQLKEFFGQSIPPYAILSHTWEADEVSFQDLQNGTGELKAGYEKIRRCCETALNDGFEYAWVDTCCIDKTSSSELSEAINSMFRWYKDAEVCYVYLADVPSIPIMDGVESSQGREDIRNMNGLFWRTRWLTRGWTLQELIAPLSVIFFSKDWSELGTKSSLQMALSAVTGIPKNILLGDRLESCSVAQRIS